MFASTASLPEASSAHSIPMFVARRQARVRASIPNNIAELDPTGTKTGDGCVAMGAAHRGKNSGKKVALFSRPLARPQEF